MWVEHVAPVPPQVRRARGWSMLLPYTSRLASESVNGARGSHPPRLAEHVGGTCGSLLLILIIAVWSKWLPSTQVRRVHSPKTGIGWQLTDTYLTALPTGKSPPPPHPCTVQCIVTASYCNRELWTLLDLEFSWELQVCVILSTSSQGLKGQCHKIFNHCFFA